MWFAEDLRLSTRRTPTPRRHHHSGNSPVAHRRTRGHRPARVAHLGRARRARPTRSGTGSRALVSHRATTSRSSRNSVNFLVAVLGAQRAGMVVTPVKTGWTTAEVEYLLSDAGSRAVVTDVGSARDAAASVGPTVIDLDDDYDAWLGEPVDARRCPTTGAAGDSRTRPAPPAAPRASCAPTSGANRSATRFPRARLRPRPAHPGGRAAPRGVPLVPRRAAHLRALGARRGCTADRDGPMGCCSRHRPPRDGRGVDDHGADDVPADARTTRSRARTAPGPDVAQRRARWRAVPDPPQAADDRLARAGVHRVLRSERRRHDARHHRGVARPTRHGGPDPRRGGGEDPRRCRPRAPSRHRGERVLRDRDRVLPLSRRSGEDRSRRSGIRRSPRATSDGSTTTATCSSPAAPPT